jgi:eukaryotic-like serine/threonine-protein kinase
MDPAEQVRVLAGRYRLDSVIGRGGMGTVWRARDQSLNRDVAVKEIVWATHLDEEEREAERRRAMREAQTAARLSHPNVVGIYDILTEEGRPWIVMEFIPYRSLRDIVREDGLLAPREAAQVGLGILAALGAAHAEGILHRDVKPANVLDPEPASHAGPLWPVISELLRKDPRERLDVDGARRMLRSVAHGEGAVPRAPVSPEPAARLQGHGGRRRSWPVAAIAVAAAVVAIGVAYGVGTLLAKPSSRHGTSAAASHPPARPSPSSPARQSTGARSSSPSASSSGSATAGTGGYGALPPGFYRFTNSTGFSIGVPRGWRISHVGHYIYLSDPSNANIYLLIDQSGQPKPNPLADWEQQQANRAGSYPDYHLIRLESVRYPQAEKAADWEFTYDRDGVPVHILNRNVLANAHHAYALYWSTPASDWTADYHFFQAFAATFRPAP